MREQSRIARRATPRYELEEELCGRTEYVSTVHLIDLSTSGALIEYHRFLKPGFELILQLPLEGGPLKVRSSVVHCAVQEIRRLPGKPERTLCRVGVKFKDLAPSGRRTIQNLILERLSNERREQPRLYVARPAQIEENIELRALNIGAKGGLFSIGYPLEPDCQYFFVFRLPGGEVKVQGVVHHCQAASHGDPEPRFQVGVEFTSFYSDGEELVLEYLAGLERGGTSGTLF